MSEIQAKPAKRKTLTLRRESKETALQEIATDPTRFTRREDCVFMVFNENGHMPKRIYRPNEVSTAILHAQQLCAETGERFHVMRSWRAYDPAGADE